MVFKVSDFVIWETYSQRIGPGVGKGLGAGAQLLQLSLEPRRAPATAHHLLHAPPRHGWPQLPGGSETQEPGPAAAGGRGGAPCTGPAVWELDGEREW